MQVQFYEAASNDNGIAEFDVPDETPIPCVGDEVYLQRDEKTLRLHVIRRVMTFPPAETPVMLYCEELSP